MHAEEGTVAIADTGDDSGGGNDNSDNGDVFGLYESAPEVVDEIAFRTTIGNSRCIFLIFFRDLRLIDSMPLNPGRP